jgi:hypothetical protein
MDQPYYPDILAVDPDGCGCTECIIGEYVPQNQWIQNANLLDVVRLLRGDVRNNTYNEDSYDLVMNGLYSIPGIVELHIVLSREVSAAIATGSPVDMSYIDGYVRNYC